MIKWFLYIVLLMISAPRLLSASTNTVNHKTFTGYTIRMGMAPALQKDTTAKAKQRQQEEDKKKIKEVAKAKKQPKPEKVEEIDPATASPKLNLNGSAGRMVWSGHPRYQEEIIISIKFTAFY
jgi:hypothetical protein